MIKEGKSYSLGVELNRDFPAYGTRFFDITVMEPRAGGQTIGPTKLTSTTISFIPGWVLAARLMALAISGLITNTTTGSPHKRLSQRMALKSWVPRTYRLS